MPNYHLPNLILSCNVWRYGKSTALAPDVVVHGNLIPGRRHVIETAPANSSPSSWLPASFLLLSLDADVRDEAGTPNLPDTIEVPAGSSRFYRVQYIEYVGLGFANQHQQAVIIKLPPFPFPPFLGIGSPELPVILTLLEPSVSDGSLPPAPLSPLEIAFLAPTTSTSSNVSKIPPQLEMNFALILPFVNTGDPVLHPPIDGVSIGLLAPVVTTASPPSLVQTMSGTNTPGVNHTANLTWPSPTTAGNTLIAVWGCNTASPSAVVVSSPWVLVESFFYGAKCLSIAVCRNAAAQTTTGLIGGGAEGCGVTCYEVVGLNISGGRDRAGLNGGVTGTLLFTPGTGVTAVANEFIVAAYWTFGTQPTFSTPGAGYTLDGQLAPPIVNAFCAMHEFVTSTGSFPSSVTASLNSNWIGANWTFA